MRNTLTIAGLGRVVRGTPTPTAPTGLFVRDKGFQGWEGLSAGRRESLARALSHGEHDVPVRLPSRVITIDGWAIARSLDELRRYSQQVSGWGATGDRFPLVIDHQLQTLTANVRRILTETDDTGSRWRVYYKSAFQAQFVAADPRRYGETATLPKVGTATTVIVFHRGNFPANPVIEIPDAPSSYTITSPVGTFTVTGATAGGVHRVDMRTGRVSRNGTWMPNVGRGPVWAVPEGARWSHVLSVPGRVLIPDTYV